MTSNPPLPLPPLPPYQYFPRSNEPQKLTFSFKLFATVVKNFKDIPGASPKLLSSNQGHPSKKFFFLVKSL